MPSVLIDETSMQKILILTDNIAIVYSGMGPDFRVLVRKGRKAAQQYFRVYRERIPVSMLVRELATVMQEFTQQGGVRPFGVSLLLAGFDHNGPQLFQVPTDTCIHVLLCHYSPDRFCAYCRLTLRALILHGRPLL